MEALDRRRMVAGMVALSATRVSAEAVSPIAHDALADNSLAKQFEAVTTTLPDVNIWGPAGKRNISELKGKTVLMPLWAEWCAPCMSELPDFARLQQKYGNDKFAIIPVLTATQRQFTPELLAGVLASAHCNVFEPLIEDRLGDRLVKTMARYHGESALPCNLLIAPDGHVVAREIGRLGNSDDSSPAKTYKETLLRMGAGAVQSRWGQPDGEQFAQAMANGFLG